MARPCGCGVSPEARQPRMNLPEACHGCHRALSFPPVALSLSWRAAPHGAGVPQSSTAALTAPDCSLRSDLLPPLSSLLTGGIMFFVTSEKGGRTGGKIQLGRDFFLGILPRPSPQKRPVCSFSPQVLEYLCLQQDVGCDLPR